MTGTPLTDADRELIGAAEDCLEAHFDPERHRVASALRTGEGEVYSAINLTTSVGSAEVHCEPITVANALMDGADHLDATVAVVYPDADPTNDPQVISACGVCRELLRDFDPAIDVIVEGPDGHVKRPVTDLLPAKQ